MAKKKTKKKPSSKKQKQGEDPVADALRDLTKQAKNGDIRGLFTIVIGQEPGQNRLRWAGQVAPGEIMLPIATAQRIFVDLALNQGRQQAGQ